MAVGIFQILACASRMESKSKPRRWKSGFRTEVEPWLMGQLLWETAWGEWWMQNTRRRPNSHEWVNQLISREPRFRSRTWLKHRKLNSYWATCRPTMQHFRSWEYGKIRTNRTTRTSWASSRTSTNKTKSISCTGISWTARRKVISNLRSSLQSRLSKQAANHSSGQETSCNIARYRLRIVRCNRCLQECRKHQRTDSRRTCMRRWASIGNDNTELLAGQARSIPDRHNSRTLRQTARGQQTHKLWSKCDSARTATSWIRKIDHLTSSLSNRNTWVHLKMPIPTLPRRTSWSVTKDRPHRETPSKRFRRRCWWETVGQIHSTRWIAVGWIAASKISACW